MEIDLISTFLSGLILTLTFYIASKIGYRKEAVALCAIGEILSLMPIILVELYYYNIAIHQGISLEDLSKFLQWFVETITQRAVETVLANLGAAIATLIIRLIEETYK